MRTACLLVPDLPLAAALRAHPELAGRPLAIAAGPGSRAELVCVSPEARARGVRPRQSAAHARSLAADLCVRAASPALASAAREALLDVALSCSPRAALAPQASGPRAAECAVFLDATGIASLFRSEPGFAAALAGRARRVGLPGTVAVASSRSAALVAARSLAEPGACRILADGAERAFLEPLPVDVLDPDDELAGALTRFGVRTLGDLLALPRRALATRLGPSAPELVRRALGRESELLLPAPGPARIAESLDLEHPIDRLEPLAFALRGVLSRLRARLELRHLACGGLDLDLELAGGGRDSRRIGVAAPTLDLRVLLRLACHALEAEPPAAGVQGLCAQVRGASPRGDQLDLFRAAGPAPARLAPALAELQALCGPDQVGAPRVADSHHPDAVELARFEPPRPGDPAPPRPPRAHPVLALRVLRPALRAEVRLAAGRPVWLRSAVATGAIVRAAGPWRVTGGWWSRELRFAFDHFDVQTADGSVARLRLDHLTRRWQVDAIYD